MTTTPSTTPSATSAWSRLSSRVIWVDLARTLLSLIPGVIALALSQGAASSGAVWPLVAIAGFGVLGASGDALRWLFTHYRISDSQVELRTGVILKQHRSLRRERIRSVDIEAKLHHRLSGLRMVKIGAGQQSAAGEAAFTLDALSREDAVKLQSSLLAISNGGPPTSPDGNPESRPTPETDPKTPAIPHRVFATFRPGWVVYNMFNVWAYVMALGLIGGTWGILSMTGVDLFGIVSRSYNWESLGWVGGTLVVLVGMTLLGWLGLTLNFFTEYWKFELARVPGKDGTQLRTRQGMFTTREVNRDEKRIRGVQIAEPLFWRWLRVTDTHVITTGLDVWSLSDPAAILPRVHRNVARRTAAHVLGEEPALFDAAVRPHPAVAWGRRMWWATLPALALLGALGVAVYTGVIPLWSLWAALIPWGIGLVGATVAYRALGHTDIGPYLLIRSGLFTRSTVVLRRDAISTIAVRESLLQKWLGLRTVTVATAAGYGGYVIPDVSATAATELAERCAPGLLEQFTTDIRTSHP
ncbi:Membrane-flanked domain-containing protein [Corynebacterium glyciniphilum AJ 3170]|uniref:Membrane-flanked domain-containing protein n=1 Tax=Corynebacterium glyciniphilum AJ 3170 TaxID=1404245 RepID=X5DUL1_9CORY|nr:PH domain-containing protein [Corynebacterium glyciniphilum]AHW64984.1 Membrane-flanked domain-containing protein [Corynebacterium glyciniphilum AJ 3170]